MIDTTAAGIDANYQYWREHGSAWVYEYTQRKKLQVLYHIEEIMLADYVRGTSRFRETPLKVLEFGCGVGRHLRNIHGLHNVEIHGYDQSEAMARGVLSWADPAWYADRIRVGNPTGPLPYDDGSFDLVYSAEVLVHVRPEHLDLLLSEILRVSRGHVLHLEPSPHIKVADGAHHGCWNHDLVAAYARLGRVCEVLPRGYDAHTPFRVAAEPAPYTWAAPILDMYRRMETDIDGGFATVREDAARAWTLRDALERENGELRSAAQAQAREHEAVLRDRDTLLGQTAEAIERRAAAEARALDLTSALEELRRNAAAAQAALADNATAWRARAEELSAALTRSREDAAVLKEACDGFLTGVGRQLTP